MDQSTNVIVQPAQPEFFEDWRRLYQGYAAFYKAPMNEDIQNTVGGAGLWIKTMRLKGCWPSLFP